MVEYDFEVLTSRHSYSLNYCNKTGRLYYRDQEINLTSSDFSVVGNTLTITFPLESADERYDNFSVSAIYLKANLFEIEPDIVFLIDIAPSPSLFIDAYTQPFSYVGENLQFYGYVEPLSGHPPCTYY